MKKFFLIIVSILVLSNCCFAQGLVLSDVIREAREAEMKQLAIKKAEEVMLKPVKNDNLNKQSTIQSVDVKQNSEIKTNQK